MEQNKLLKGIYLAACFSLLFLAGCQKDQSSAGTAPEFSPAEEEDIALSSTQAESENEFVFNALFDDVMGVNTEVGLGGTGVFGRAESVDSMTTCMRVTTTLLHPPDRFPMRVVTDFGTGCRGRDGIVRSGKIITVYSGKLTMAGKEATTTFDNYKIDSISVEGSFRLKNTSSTTTPQYTIDVVNAKLSHPNGNYSEWNSHRVKTQVEGHGTPYYSMDDVFEMTGQSHGKIKRGTRLTSWESVITEPLRSRFNCRWIVKGKIRTHRSQATAGSAIMISLLDYGNGVCDRYAILTINGVSRQIILY